MKPRVYVETSVVSYLAARPSRDAIKAARQWQAQALWNAMDGMTQLGLSPETDYLAQLLIERKALPALAVADAAHIAIATIHRVKAIASFNFRHIAGAFARRSIEMTLRQLGYEPPVIATPEEILGGINE